DAPPSVATHRHVAPGHAPHRVEDQTCLLVVAHLDVLEGDRSSALPDAILGAVDEQVPEREVTGVRAHEDARLTPADRPGALDRTACVAENAGARQIGRASCGE